MRLPWLSPQLIFILTFSSTAVYLAMLPQTPELHVPENIEVGQSLAVRGTFSDPFNHLQLTGPTAHVAPVYPLIAAALWTLFSQKVAIGILVLLNMLLIALQASLLPALSRRILGSGDPGTWGAICMIALPLIRVDFTSEAMLAATGAMGCVFLTDRFPLAGGSRVGPVLFGTVAGVLILVNPASFLVTGPWAIYKLLARTATSRSRWESILVLSAAVAMVCGPWVWRNHRELGAWTFIRDNLGLELQISNNDGAKPTLHRNDSAYSLHPHFNPLETREMAGLGETEYYSRKLRASLEWIRSHPARFVLLTARRLLYFWFPESAFGLYSFATWIVTLASMAGLFLMFRNTRACRWFFAAVFLAYPTMYYVVQASPRYRYPILWLSILSAGYGIAVLRPRLRGAPDEAGFSSREAA